MHYRILFLLALLLAPFAVQAQEGLQVEKAHEIVQMLIDGDIAGVYDQFSDQIKAALPQDQFQQAWDSIIQSVGAFDEITGTREQGGQVILTMRFEAMSLDAHLAFDAAGAIIALNFTPAATGEPTATIPAPTPVYADAAAFTEREVTVGAFDLPGVLTLPNGDGPLPAVALISGSGPNDRDETVGPNKPFRDIAWGLASQGIASVRFDKSTLAASGALDIPTLTVKEEYVDDSLAAIELLRGTDGIDPARVFILGHSEGGYVAPRIAAAAGDQLAGVVFVAALATPLTDALIRQTHYLVDQQPGLTDDQQQAAIDQIQAIVNQINALTEDSPADQIVFGAPPSYWIDLRDYDPVALAATLDLPMLFVQGGRDYQVTVEDDLVLWEAGLQGRDYVTFQTYPDLNHLLVTGEGMSVPAEYQQPGNVSQALIDDIAAWIEAQ